jgi:hypothetical protein
MFTKTSHQNSAVGGYGTKTSAVLITSLFLVLAVIAGLLATTASPIPIGVFVGLILGVGFLVRPAIAIWLVIAGALFFSGMIVQFAPQYSKAAWLFSMVGFLLFAGALIQFVGKPSIASGLPGFAWLALSFPVYVILISVANAPDIAEFLAGFKRYFQYWGVFAALVLIPFKDGLFRNIFRFAMLIGLVQVFFALYQVWFVVPSREGMGGGVVAIDAVSGTFEAFQTGGGSKQIMVMFTLVLFCYVLNAWRENGQPTLRTAIYSILLLAPLFLGQSKIALIALPMVILIAIQRDMSRSPVTAALILIATAAVTAFLAYLYLTLTARGHDSLEQTIYRVNAYNFGNVGYGALSGLNRLTALTFWYGHQSWGDPIGFMFGHGIGSSYEGETTLVIGHLAAKYRGLAIGLTTLSTLLWDTGIVGVTWFSTVIMGAVWRCHRTLRTLPTGALRSIGVAIEAGLLMNLLMLPYANSMLALPSHEVILMTLLAGAVLLVKKSTKSDAKPTHAGSAPA